MFAMSRRRNPGMVRPARRVTLGPGVEPLDDRVLPSAAIAVLPAGGPLVADTGTATGFTAPLGSDKGSIRAPGCATLSIGAQSADPVRPAEFRPQGLPLLGEEPIYYPGM